jgi:hypothetical protein
LDGWETQFGQSIDGGLNWNMLDSLRINCPLLKFLI